jgi:RNA polymerase sigma factor (sigma-70 family)
VEFDTAMSPPRMTDLAALYDAHQGVVRRRIRRFVHDPQTVDELMQDTWERAVRHREGFDGRSTPVTWLYQIATRVCLHHLRDRGRRADILERAGTPPWGRPSVTDGVDTALFLRQAWRHLDPELAEIGTYHHVDGLTHAEIAAILGCSRRTVGNRLAALRREVQRLAEPVEEP